MTPPCGVSCRCFFSILASLAIPPSVSPFSQFPALCFSVLCPGLLVTARLTLGSTNRFPPPGLFRPLCSLVFKFLSMALPVTLSTFLSGQLCFSPIRVPGSLFHKYEFLPIQLHPAFFTQCPPFLPKTPPHPPRSCVKAIFLLS